MAKAADHARLITHADLAHVDAHMEARGELAHELAEVDALLRLEVEDRLVALEQVFHRHRMHVLVRLGGHLLEDGQRLATEPLHLGGAFHVLGRGDALHGLERRFQLLHLVFVNLEDVACGMAELDAARGEHHHVVAVMNIQITRVEPQRARIECEPNGRDSNHTEPLSLQTASHRCTFLGKHYTR